MKKPEAHIEKLDDARHILHFALDEICPAFSGHFPGQPILPGVVQLDWVMQYASQIYGVKAPVAQDFQVKFQNIIGPGSLSLNIDYDNVQRRLNFSYNKNGTLCSSGKIKIS